MFAKMLAGKLRSNDTHGFWAKKDDEQILKQFIKTKEEKKQIDIMKRIDDKTLWVIRMFYETIALAAEKEAKTQVSCVLDIGAEGFGKVLVYSEMNILLIDYLRDAHKFGFENLENLDSEGNKKIAKCLKNLNKE